METMRTTLTDDLRYDRARYLRNLERSRNEKYYKMDTEAVVSSYAIFFAIAIVKKLKNLYYIEVEK